MDLDGVSCDGGRCFDSLAPDLNEHCKDYKINESYAYGSKVSSEEILIYQRKLKN